MSYMNANSVGKKEKKKEMKKIEVTMQEIWQVTKPVIYKNKKKYTRKTKHNERI